MRIIAVANQPGWNVKGERLLMLMVNPERDQAANWDGARQKWVSGLYPPRLALTRGGWFEGQGSYTPPDPPPTERPATA